MLRSVAHRPTNFDAGVLTTVGVGVNGEDASLEGPHAVPELGLHSGAATGNIGQVKFALENGQPVWSVLDGLLPLHAASAGGSDSVVRMLLSYGADVNASVRQRSLKGSTTSSRPGMGAEGATALHFAAAEGHVGIVRLLLDRGAKPTEQDSYGNTPERLAIDNGHAACVSLLRSWQSAYGPQGLANLVFSGSSTFVAPFTHKDPGIPTKQTSTPEAESIAPASSSSSSVSVNNGKREPHSVRSQRSLDHISLAAAGVKASLLAKKNHALAKVSSNPNLKSAVTATPTSPPTPPPPLPSRKSTEGKRPALPLSADEGAQATAMHFIAPQNKRRPSLPSIFERAAHPSASLRAAVGGAPSTGLRTEIDAEVGDGGGDPSAAALDEPSPLSYNVNTTTPPSPLRQTFLGSKRSFSNIVRKATSNSGNLSQTSSSTNERIPSESMRLPRSRLNESSSKGLVDVALGGDDSAQGGSRSSAPPPVSDSAYNPSSARMAAELSPKSSEKASLQRLPSLVQQGSASQASRRVSNELGRRDVRGTGGRQRSQTTSYAGQEASRLGATALHRAPHSHSRSHSSDGVGGEEGVFEDAQEYLDTPNSSGSDSGRLVALPTQKKNSDKGLARQLGERSDDALKILSPPSANKSLPTSSLETSVTEVGSVPRHSMILHKPRSTGSLALQRRSSRSRMQSQQQQQQQWSDSIKSTPFPHTTRASRADSMTSKASSSSLASHSASDHAQAILRNAEHYGADGKVQREDGTQITLTQMLAAYGEALAMERSTVTSSSSVSSSGHSVTLSPIRKQTSIASLSSRGVTLRSVQEDDDRPPLPKSNAPILPRALSDSSPGGDGRSISEGGINGGVIGRASSFGVQASPPAPFVGSRTRAQSIEDSDVTNGASSSNSNLSNCSRKKLSQTAIRGSSLTHADEPHATRRSFSDDAKGMVQERDRATLVKSSSNGINRSSDASDDISISTEAKSPFGLLPRSPIGQPTTRPTKSDNPFLAPTNVSARTSPYISPSTPVSPASAYFGESSTSTSTSVTTPGPPAAPVHKHSPSLPTDLGFLARDLNFGLGHNKDIGDSASRRLREATTDSQKSEDEYIASTKVRKSSLAKAGRSYTDLSDMPQGGAAAPRTEGQTRPSFPLGRRLQSGTSSTNSSVNSTPASVSSNSSSSSSNTQNISGETEDVFASTSRSTSRPMTSTPPFSSLLPADVASSPSTSAHPSMTSPSGSAPKKKSTMKAFFSGIRQNVSK